MAERDASTPLPLPRSDPARDANPPPDTSIVPDSYGQLLQHLIRGAVPQDEFAPLIEAIFSDKKVADIVNGIPENNAQPFIDAIDTV